MSTSKLLEVPLSTGRKIRLALTLHNEGDGQPAQVSYDYIEPITLTKAERTEYLTWIHGNNREIAAVMGEPVLYGFQPAPGVIQLWRYHPDGTAEKMG